MTYFFLNCTKPSNYFNQCWPCFAMAITVDNLFIIIIIIIIIMYTFLVSEETVQLPRWESETWKFGFIIWVYKGWVTTVKDLENWRFKHRPFVRANTNDKNNMIEEHPMRSGSWTTKKLTLVWSPLIAALFSGPFRVLPYLPVYKSIPCISGPPTLEPKNVSFILEFSYRCAMVPWNLSWTFFHLSFCSMNKSRAIFWTDF